MLIADVDVMTGAPSSLPESNEVNGSIISLEGEVMGVGSVEGMTTLALVARRLDELFRAAFDEEGDASRDKVLRKVDLRLGGRAGRVDASMGSAGRVAPGMSSRSFWSNSTISTAVRVSVKLCVGAVDR